MRRLSKSFPQYIYLHGFASAPGSSKAQYYAERLQELGLKVQIPDLNRPAFRQLTLSSQLSIIDKCISDIEDSDIVMIGSSMGGLLATLQSQRSNSIKGLILLAPGFGLPRRWQQMLGDEGVEKWKQSGYVEVFHHGTNNNEELGVEFIIDAQNYQTDDLEVTIPTLLFHGIYDDTVPIEESRRFAHMNQTLVEYHELIDDHQLISSLPEMWKHSYSFLSNHHFAPAGVFTPFGQ